MTPEDRSAEMEAEKAALRMQLGELPDLREQPATLAAEVPALRVRLAKDSDNSSNPSSCDWLARKTRSLRRRSVKKPGGQVGHRGHTLRRVGNPDVVWSTGRRGMPAARQTAA